jgi:hypothetical protein
MPLKLAIQPFLGAEMMPSKRLDFCGGARGCGAGPLGFRKSFRRCSAQYCASPGKLTHAEVAARSHRTASSMAMGARSCRESAMAHVTALFPRGDQIPDQPARHPAAVFDTEILWERSRHRSERLRPDHEQISEPSRSELHNVHDRGTAPPRQADVVACPSRTVSEELSGEITQVSVIVPRRRRRMAYELVSLKHHVRERSSVCGRLRERPRTEGTVKARECRVAPGD